MGNEHDGGALRRCGADGGVQGREPMAVERDRGLIQGQDLRLACKNCCQRKETLAGCGQFRGVFVG